MSAPRTGPAVLVIAPSGFGELTRLPAGDAAQVHALQAAVGGYIEAVGGDGWTAWVNEEGKLLGLPGNPRADLIARMLGWQAAGDHLVGTVVFTGRHGAEIADIPAFAVEIARDARVITIGADTP